MSAHGHERERHRSRHSAQFVRFDHEAPQCGTPAQHALCCNLARDCSFASLLYGIAVIMQWPLESVRRRKLRPLDAREVSTLIDGLKERAR